MGYRIGYNGPQVDDLLQKGYKYSVINNGWTKLESSDLAATNLDTLVTPSNYSTSFWQNGPIQLVTNGPINVCVTKDSSSNTLYQTIYDAGKIYIRSTTSTSFSNTWREEQNNSSLEIGASTPVNPSDNYIWIDTSGDAPVIKIYKENKGEWVAISAADLAKKSVYDKNNVGKPFTTYLDEKIAEGDLATAEDAYKKHIVEGEDTGNPIHVTSEEKLKWNAGISTSEADTLINKFKKDMQSYADEKVNTSSTKINEITTEVNAQKKIMDNHMGDNTIHLTADQVTAFDNKAAGDHTHLNDGTVTVSTTNLTGLIPIERLDPTVLERNYTVSSYDDLFNLTKNEVQNGDSVYVNETHPSAWFVVDDSKLGEYELESWTQGTMPSSSQSWTSVCYGNGKFVVISSNSNIFAYSTDSINWTEGTMPSSQPWCQVCYGNDKFVAIVNGLSKSNVFAYSTDGINWTEGTMPSSQKWYSVCYGNGKFVAITSSSVFAYSTDGINWTQGTMPSSQSWRFACYGNGKFVALSRNSNSGGSNIFAYSTDGITWTQGTMPSTQPWCQVCYGNDKFIDVVYGSNVFAYSTNGINWTQGTMPSSQSWTSVCYGNGKFVAIAYYSNVFAYSTDGINWIAGNMSDSSKWYSVCYGNGKFVAVVLGSNTFAYSSLNKLPTALVQYAAPTPELTWGNITNKPTTISDYGLSNTYYTADEINTLYNQYKTQYDEINKSVSDITDSLLEIPEDLSTTYDTNLARASELNKKLDDLLHSLGLNDKMISDMVNMYKERSIIYKNSGTGDLSKTITVKYVYLNPSTDNLPAAAISNKPADSTYSMDYTTPNYTHTIDDNHYPEGYTMSSDDGTGYWVFSGWEIDTTGQKTVTVSYQYIINGDSSLLPNEITTNKPADVSYDVDYNDEQKASYMHTIDDEHYPEGYIINSTDGSGYWEFSGWKE